MASCGRCLHFDVCPVAHPSSSEINYLIGRFFGRTEKEIAEKCNLFLDSDFLDHEKIKSQKLELIENESL